MISIPFHETERLVDGLLAGLIGVIEAPIWDLAGLGYRTVSFEDRHNQRRYLLSFHDGYIQITPKYKKLLSTPIDKYTPENIKNCLIALLT